MPTKQAPFAESPTVETTGAARVKAITKPIGAVTVAYANTATGFSAAADQS